MGRKLGCSSDSCLIHTVRTQQSLVKNNKHHCSSILRGIRNEDNTSGTRKMLIAMNCKWEEDSRDINSG
jgi:hypothetical protein